MMKHEVEIHLLNIYQAIGIDYPTTHDDILEYIYNDVVETSDRDNWHKGDVATAFRRYLQEARVT